MKTLFAVVFAFLFAGCASSAPSVSSHVSEPVFIEAADVNASVFVKFKNSVNGDESVSAAIARELGKMGFTSAPDAASADYVVLGEVQNFERAIKRDYNPRFFGSFGYGRRPFWGLGAAYYFDDEDDYYTNSYSYAMSASVSVRQKGKEPQNTVITLTHARSNYSKDYMWPYFVQRLAKQIANFFYLQ